MNDSKVFKQDSDCTMWKSNWQLEKVERHLGTDHPIERGKKCWSAYGGGFAYQSCRNPGQKYEDAPKSWWSCGHCNNWLMDFHKQTLQISFKIFQLWICEFVSFNSYTEILSTFVNRKWDVYLDKNHKSNLKEAIKQLVSSLQL